MHTRTHGPLLCVGQFSGQCADEMRKAYAEFCSRHPKAVKLYKELLARDKRFQHFIRVREEGGREGGEEGREKTLKKVVDEGHGDII